ncbi:hypothetical protein ACJMK2_029499 [Sinanodonta woodiana]|uniref:Uncharacterized protein n=1 Tax=Sinanodonta woodiana TaxID=1069815 RepID=A0ABD3XAB2_SINWO
MSNLPVHSEPERQPLHNNTEEQDADHEIDHTANNNSEIKHAAKSLIEHHQGELTENEVVMSYSMEPAFHNTLENPYRETTITVPHYVKRVPSCDLTPAPYKSFNQVIVLSYLSTIFCCCIGAFAAKLALKAKLHQAKGLYGLAQRDSKRAVLLSYISFATGMAIALIIVLVVVLSTDKS